MTECSAFYATHKTDALHMYSSSVYFVLLEKNRVIWITIWKRETNHFSLSLNAHWRFCNVEYARYVWHHLSLSIRRFFVHPISIPLFVIPFAFFSSLSNVYGSHITFIAEFANAAIKPSNAKMRCVGCCNRHTEPSSRQNVENSLPNE